MSVSCDGALRFNYFTITSWDLCSALLPDSYSPHPRVGTMKSLPQSTCWCFRNNVFLSLFAKSCSDCTYKVHPQPSKETLWSLPWEFGVISPDDFLTNTTFRLPILPILNGPKCFSQQIYSCCASRELQLRKSIVYPSEQHQKSFHSTDCDKQLETSEFFVTNYLLPILLSPMDLPKTSLKHWRVS